MKLTNFEQLEAWQQVRKLAKVIYQFVKKQNFSKDFRLVNQTTGKTNVKCGDLTPPISLLLALMRTSSRLFLRSK